MPKIRTSQARTNRVTTRAILLLFTAFLALGAGVFNLRDRLSQKEVLTDGVVWRDQALGVRAVQVEPGSPGSLADVRPGDYLIGISTSGSEPFEVVEEARYVQIYLDQARDQIASGGPLTLSYWIERRNDSGDTVLREGIADLDRLATQETHILRGLYLALIGLIYLGIGIYFLLRQGRAPYLNLFFLICLLAFISHFYSPTIEMRTHFDKMVDFADVAALILLAPLLVHFAAIYPGRQPLPTRRGWLALAGYGPAVLLLGAELMLRFDPLRGLLLFPAVTVRSTLNRIEILLFGLSLLTSGFLFIRTFRGARSVIVRQQLKWVMWGMSIAAVTFAVFYLPSFLAIESVASVLEMTALAPLIMVPVTLGYSIVRYRLMDVDVVMRRSFAYIVATLSVAALFGTVMAVSYEFLRSLIPQEATLLIAAVTMSIIAMLFAPVKNWVQERIDRLFYGEKYDYRLTLQDFGRTLSSTTELDPLLESLVRRLREVFAIEHLAILIEDRGAPSGFRMARSEGVSSEVTLPGDFIRQLREHSSATSIVRIDEMEPEGSEWPRQLERPGIESAGTALTDQPFSYYVPCAVRSRVVAVIALGRLADGALLSSEDLGLLRAISGYVAVAIENSLLLDEQARRARELARLKEFNENIIESITIGVLVISLGGRITNWNSALELIYGLPREKAIGQRVSEVFDPESLRNLRELMKAGDWSAGEQANIYKLRARSFDGRDLILNVSLAPLQSRHEEFAGTLVAIEDVTERIRLEEQLRQNDKLSSIGLLAAGVAHEVNTPLTGISSYSQMLMQQIPESDSRHQLLQKIYRQTSRASSIVNNLLNFSRVSDSRMVAVDLNQVLDDTIQLLESQLHNTRIEVVRDYAGDLPAAPGNAPKLQQVFMNLILNARDAMPNGGELKISTTCADDSIVIVFSDTGEGISPEHLSRIYDPFFTTKQIGKGTGLGLAVSYGIVQDHGGLMTVESRPGEGTLFRIALPLANVQPELVATGD